jgi:tetratricopeptide (TPR) repeat protein
VRQHPENALAHYHLGYAYGMLGNGFSELKEYRQAEALRLRRWDLYLNMGLAQRDIGQLESATRSMQRSVFIGPEHPESHLDLALLYHDQGRLADAERETKASLRLSHSQPDALNLLGVIYAQEGRIDRAFSIWRRLINETPGFAPARANLEALSEQFVNAPRKTSTAITLDAKPEN